MNSQHWSVLIVGDIGHLNPSIEPILRRTTITVERAPQGADGLERARNTAYDLIILELPLPDIDLRTFVKTLREPGSASHASGVLVTGHTQEHDDVSFFLGRGINRFVAPDASGGEWLDALATLLAVPPRASLRALVQIETVIRGLHTRTLAQTENLSATGMLIRGDSRHSRPGSTIEFELILPGEDTPIRGTATIVRRSDKDREKIDGFGVQFVSFEDDGRRILDEFLERFRARRTVS